MFIAAGLVEERLKYLPVTYARRRYEGTRKTQHRNRVYIDYAISTALSFGLLESIGFIYAARQDSCDTWPKFLLTLVERLVIGQIGHLSAAALTAIRAIMRDYYGDDLSWWGVVGPAVMFHGMLNFVAVSRSAAEGNVGWIHPSDLRIVVPELGDNGWDGCGVGTAGQKGMEGVREP
jgi:RsiW-degrading membrane proteinase PrsW (M82 family)